MADHTVLSALYVPKFQTPEEKQIFSINQAVCTNNLGVVSQSYQLMVGACPKLKIPGANLANRPLSVERAGMLCQLLFIRALQVAIRILECGKKTKMEDHRNMRRGQRPMRMLMPFPGHRLGPSTPLGQSLLQRST